MSIQDKTAKLTKEQKEILEIEKDYFKKLDEIICSDDFQTDLKNIEEEIQLNYSKLASTWNLKNKIKVAAERLIRHHVYKNLLSEIVGIYESPISSDLGIVFKDCILCIDSKTLDTKGNAQDIRYTSVEPNQTSFDNSNHPYIKTVSNLETRARKTRLPILTYVIKIIYCDDNVRFDISRTTNAGKKPSLILACIPNGELSSLFNKDLIQNFKTYKYHTESEGVYYTPIVVPKSEKNKENWVDVKCKTLGYTKYEIPQTRGTKKVYFDAAHNCYWTYTSENKKKTIRAISYGDSMRLNNDYLKNRFDSKGNDWVGYKEINI